MRLRRYSSTRNFSNKKENREEELSAMLNGMPILSESSNNVQEKESEEPNKLETVDEMNGETEEMIEEERSDDVQPEIPDVIRDALRRRCGKISHG